MLDPFLKTEIIKSEKKRLEVFLGVFSLAFVLGVMARIFYYQEIEKTFNNTNSFYALITTILLMIILVYLSRLWVIRLLRRNGRITNRYYLFNLFIEIYIPASLLVILAVNERSAQFADSPAIFLFFVLIIVSSLHLSFVFSAVMGFLIGSFYLGYTYWVISAYPEDLGLPLYTYYMRGVIYMVAGVCAGLVGMELRNRLTSTHKNIIEKEEIEGLFSQQISRGLVEMLKEKKDYAERVNATLIFLDIRDFTEKVQHLSPEQVNAFQNKFFAPIIDIIISNNGIVNQILGDGLMATFGIPLTDSGHPLKAWSAVQSILLFMEQFREDNMKYHLIDIGIGMHHGEVMVGNIGTKARKQLSISGKAVIVASRIEQFNKELNSTLLMSGELYDLLADEIGGFKSRSSYKLKGIDEKITIVEIL